MTIIRNCIRDCVGGRTRNRRLPSENGTPRPDRRPWLRATTAVCIAGLALAGVAVADGASLKANGLPEGSGSSEVLSAMEERAEEYAPEVRTLSDGTLVQRTPSIDSGYFCYPDTSTSYNTYYLKADQRGCDSCHTEGLAYVVEQQMLQTHVPVSNGYGTDVTVMQCRLCHDVGTGYVAKNFEFGNLIHGIHMNVAGAECFSCHAATSDGQGLTLWDEVKHEVLQGITYIDAENVEAEFSWEQDTLSESMFQSMWMSTDTQIDNIGKTQAGEPLDPEVFDNWTISVTGKVDNPFTMTLPELIAEAPSETIVCTQQCGMNPAGGDLIANVEITGIPISWLLEKAGVQEGATAVMATAPDGWARGNLLENIAERDGYLVYEINGEPLDWVVGYPVRTWWPGRSAQNQIRWTGELNVVDTPVEKIKQFKGWYLNERNTIDAGSGTTLYGSDAIGTGWNKPNAGIFYLHEGEILEAGVAHEFEGYASAFDTQIVAVEFSLDDGKTWTRYETPNSDLTRWVYWHFTFTPEEPGAYVLSVRSVTADGAVGYLPDSVMFNAQ